MKTIRITVLLLFLAFVLTAVYITIDGLTDDYTTAGAAVVLGNTVNPDGSLSPRLLARLDKALELYRNNSAALVIVSGARGREGWNEATVMASYLKSQGMPDSALIADTTGSTTRQTAVNVTQICRNRKIQSLIIVSQFFHLTRSRTAFRQAGFDSLSTAHADYYELRDIYSLTREAIGLYTYLFRY